MKSHYNLRSRDGSHGNKSGRKEANGNTPADTTDSSGKGEERSDSGSMQAVVFVTLIVDLLAFTMILPLLPSLLDYYSQNDKVRAPSSLLTYWTSDVQRAWGPNTQVP